MPGRLAITLKPRGQRSARVEAIIERLKQSVAGDSRHDGVFPGGAGHPDFDPRQPRAISIHADRRPTRRKWSIGPTSCAQALRTDPALREVASEAQEGGPRVLVDVDREKAGRLGVSMQTVTDTLNDAFGQRQISTIYAQANQYRVILEAQPQYQRDPSALSKIYVTGDSTANGTTPTVGNTATGTTNTNTSATPNAVTGSTQVPLAAFARFEHTSAPLAIAHQEQFPSVTISFDLAPWAALSRRGRSHFIRRSSGSACRPP